jgi:excisionase family DNA binding protein
MLDAIEGFYTVAEFIRLYGVPRSSFYRLVKEGRLRIHKIGRASRIAKAEARVWAGSLPTFGGEVRP